MTVHLFIYSTGSRIQQYSIEGAAVSRVQCKCLVRFHKSPTNFPVIMQASDFLRTRSVGDNAQHPRLT